jgi:NTP pyrophosphatase (non-canonical NTP hydrolase)
MGKFEDRPFFPPLVIWPGVVEFTNLLDNNGRVTNIDPSHELSLRVAKTAEEAGEAVSARLRQLAQSPEKMGSEQDVLDELADVILAAAVAMYSITRDIEHCESVIITKQLSALHKKKVKLAEIAKKQEGSKKEE